MNLSKAARLRTQWIVFAGLILCSLLLPLPARADGSEVLDGFIAEAVAHNPDLKAAEEMVGAAAERPSQQEALDNPRLGFGLVNLPVDSFSFSKEPMTQKVLSLAQKLPFPGKLSLRGDIARTDTEIAEQALAEKRNVLVMQVKTVYRELLLTARSIEITEKDRDLIRQFVTTAETRYASGQGIQQDVLKAQVELSKMLDMVIALKRTKEGLLARFNSLLYRPADARISDFDGREIDLLKATDLTYGADDLEKIAADARPVLAVARKRIDRARLALRLAEKNYYPDMDVTFSYGQRDDGAGQKRVDFVSGTLMVSLPLWYKSKEDRKVAEESRVLREAEQEYESMKNEISFKIQDSVAAAKRYREQMDLIRTGLLPQSKAALESAIAGYGVNKVDFITLVNNLMTSYNYEIAYYRALTDYENTLAALEAAVGRRLF